MAKSRSNDSSKLSFGQSYKAPMIVAYVSRVVNMSNLFINQNVVTLKFLNEIASW